MTVRDGDARPKRRDALRNHGLVVKAAHQVVAEFGTEASMELIASRAGVGVGTVYRCFGNKDALLDELVRLIVEDLLDAAREALARNDGTGLEIFLGELGRSFFDHRGYGNTLVSRTKAQCADQFRGLIDELLVQAQRYGRFRADITLGDVMSTVWAIRGIIGTTGKVAPRAWERHLDIHLAGMRAAEAPSGRTSITRDELARISGEGRVPAAPEL